MFEETFSDRLQTGWALMSDDWLVTVNNYDDCFSDNGNATEKMLNALDGVDPMEEQYREFERKKRAAMKSLTPRQREFVRLKLRGWSDIEIARKWGINRGDLFDIKQAAQKKFKKVFG